MPLFWCCHYYFAPLFHWLSDAAFHAIIFAPYCWYFFRHYADAFFHFIIIDSHFSFRCHFSLIDVYFFHAIDMPPPWRVDIQQPFRLTRLYCLRHAISLSLFTSLRYWHCYMPLMLTLSLDMPAAMPFRYFCCRHAADIYWWCCSPFIDISLWFFTPLMLNIYHCMSASLLRFHAADAFIISLYAIYHCRFHTPFAYLRRRHCIFLPDYQTCRLEPDCHYLLSFMLLMLSPFSLRFSCRH